MRYPRQTPDDVIARAGTTVEDVYGARVGSLEGTYFDYLSERPVWMIIQVGRWSGRLALAPLRQWIPSDDVIFVPYERRQIRSAPAPAGLGPLRREDELELCRHYGWTEGRQQEVEGQIERSRTAAALVRSGVRVRA